MPARRASLSYVKGIHNIKVGINYEDTILTENDTFGIVDPTANAVCLNADGSPDTESAVDQSGELHRRSSRRIPSFIPLLACYDLTRTGPLPASDGCPNSTSGSYTFQRPRRHQGAGAVRPGHHHAEELDLQPRAFAAIYTTASPCASQAEPRLGIAYNIKPTNTVLRVSYARTMETPFNENLVLASVGCNDPVINALMSVDPAAPCVTTAPLSPGIRNEFHAGLPQAFGRYLVVDGEYIWKYTHKAYDFSVLGDTPITFPSSGRDRKFRDTRSAPACRTSTA